MLRVLDCQPWFLAQVGPAVVDKFLAMFVCLTKTHSSVDISPTPCWGSPVCSRVAEMFWGSMEVSGWELAQSACLASLQICTLYSCCNSLVSNWMHVFWLKSQSLTPKNSVNLSNSSRIRSWWMQNFTKQCQWAMVKSNSTTTLLCGLGNNPSKTSIEHWI